MIAVARCPIDSLDWAWSKSAGHVKRAIEYSGGRYGLDDVYRLLGCGKAQLWVIADGPEILAACVTQLSPYPAKLYLTVLFVGGSGINKWLGKLIASLKRFATDNSCEGIEMYGRPGWTRVIDKHGFTLGDSIFMELAL